MKCFIFLTTVFQIVTTAIYCQNLSVRVELDSHEYLERENFRILIELQNHDTKDVYIPHFAAEEDQSRIEVILKDSLGVRVYSEFKYSEEGGHDKFIFKRGSSIFNLYRVGEFYDNNKTIDENARSNTFLTSGKYSIQVVYHYINKDNSSDIIAKDYYSNIEEFTIIKPKDKEDIEAVNDLIYTKKHYNNKNELTDFIKKHPRSNYTMDIYNRLILYKRWGKDIDLQTTIKEMCEKYPDSFTTLETLYYTENIDSLYSDSSFQINITNSKINKYVNKLRERK